VHLALRRWSAFYRPLRCHCGLPDIESELEQFIVNPQWRIDTLISRMSWRISAGVCGPRVVVVSSAQTFGSQRDPNATAQDQFRETCDPRYR